MTRTFLAVLFVLAFLASPFVYGQTPDRSGTLSRSSARFEWTAPAATGANAGFVPQLGAPCGKDAATYCDVTLFHVDVDPSFWSSESGGMVVLIRPGLKAPTRMDVYVYQSDATGKRGALVASSNNCDDTGCAGARYAAVRKASGFYLVVVVYVFVTDMSGYTGTASFIPSSATTVRDRILTQMDFAGICVPGPTEAIDPTYADCMGQMQSWDRMGIGIRLRVPEGAKGPLPTLLYHHAFDSARGEWELHEPSHFAPRWFLAKGYAAVSYSSRGNHSSCGFVQFQVTGDPPSHGPGGDPTCTEGYAHLAERSFETRDSQHLLGLLVDAHISDAERLAALGVSYGAGQTWLLATSTPWRTPSGLRSLQLAAAIPWAGWTDFWNAVVPNGRASDGWDQSASPERPHGVMKQGYDDGFYASQAQYPGFIRYNELKAGELHSFFRGWIEFWHKGEPYEISELPVVDKDGSVQTITASKLSAAFRNKSAYYAEDYFNAILQGTARPVPVLAVDGWSDTLFTPVESFQMYRKLKTLKPDYPVFLAFESGGLHGSLSLDVEKSYLFDRINQFLDKFLGTGGDGSLPPAVFSFRTQCPVPDDTRSGATLPPSVSGPDWDSVRTGVVTLERTETIKTNSALPNLAEESATDPVANPIRCMSQSAGSYDSSKGWTWRVDNAFTLLGLPTVKLTYTLLGEDATVVAKLWDVLPDGTRFLVTRGVYRLSVTTGDSQSGTLSFQLFGNHYRFEQGHSIALQLSQTDVTFLKPDSLPSSITFSAGRITLPIQ